ncbi:hypothetical protein RYX36_017953 [Vicia faba]
MVWYNFYILFKMTHNLTIINKICGKEENTPHVFFESKGAFYVNLRIHVHSNVVTGKEENTSHVFFGCSVAEEAWQEILRWTKINSALHHTALENYNFQDWSTLAG